ncbi:MAG: hypothetical protein II695_03825, partial [Oscillospiraceae bacterium]|nr:hypothetical protein [Oscillospiraceae bacterium]
MRKNIRIAAALASLAVLSSVAAPAVSATSTPVGQKYNTKLISDVSGATQNADNFNSYTSNGFTTYNATEFKKVLEIEDDGNIPAVTFTYNITLPTENKPAVYDGGTLKSLAVYKGINPQNINYKLITVNDSGFNTDGSTDTVGITKISPATAGDPTGFELTYKAQKVTGGDANTVDAFVPDASTADGTSPKKAPIDDNVLINNVKQDKTNTDSNVDTYYAIKTVQMDFSGCGFTEPGIYRYYITETGSNVAGMKCGQTSDLTKAAETVRTVDVYVEDATFMDGTVEKNYLRIAGYVMYVGEQTVGPNKVDPDPAPTAVDPANWQVNLEDGMTNTSSTTNYGKVNGAEIMNGTDPVQKSEGIPNFYSTNDITFGKTVTGNQGSKDKYFKFTLQLTADTAGTNSDIVGDKDTFAITGIWDKTVTAG